jgi:hypothetical protein
MVDSSMMYAGVLLIASYAFFLSAIQCVAVGPDAGADWTPSRLILNYIDHSYDCLASSKMYTAGAAFLSLLCAAMAGTHAGACAFGFIARTVQRL